MSEEVDNILAHFGVKGMQWGKRKGDSTGGESSAKPISKRQAKLETRFPSSEHVFTKETKNGSTLTLSKITQTDFEKVGFTMYEGPPSLFHAFELSDKENRRVGEAAFYQSETHKDRLELEWVGVDKNHRSNGYARAALEGAIDYAKDNGIRELNMSATKMGQPLYESLGFTRTGKGSDHWWSLPEYRLEIEPNVKHSDFAARSLADYISDRIDSSEEINGEDQVIEGPLAHYGIPGMKWGKRKESSPEESAKTRSNLKKGAIIVGAVAVAAGVAFVAYKMNKPGLANIPVASLKTNPTAQAGKTVFDTMAKSGFKAPPKANVGIPDLTRDFNQKKVSSFLQDQQRNTKVIRDQVARDRAQDNALIGDISEMLRKAR